MGPIFDLLGETETLGSKVRRSHSVLKRGPQAAPLQV